MVFAREVVLSMGQKLTGLEGKEIYLLVTQKIELEGIDEDLGMGYQNYCVDLIQCTY